MIGALLLLAERKIDFWTAAAENRNQDALGMPLTTVPAVQHHKLNQETNLTQIRLEKLRGATEMELRRGCGAEPNCQTHNGETSCRIALN